MSIEKKKRGGARPGSGRKPTGPGTTISFRIPSEMKKDATAEAKRRKAAGEKSLNKEFLEWFGPRVKKK